MRPSKLKIMVCFICLAFLALPKAHAQFFMGDKHREDREMMGKKMEERIQQIYGQLNLSEEQKRLLEENKARHKAVKEATSKELKAVMQAMGDELKKPDLDLARITAIQNDFKRLRDTMADGRFNAILEVRKILTRDQFVKFVDLMEEQRASKTDQ